MSPGGFLRGVLLGCFSDPPCSSWSIARHGPLGSLWGPLRSRECIMGIPGLPPRDVAKIELGNATMMHTARTVRQCLAFGVPAVLENPASSRLFHAPPLAALIRRPTCQQVVLDLCQFGAPWRKHTKLACWLVAADSAEVGRVCKGKHGVCSRTMEPHFVLEGPKRTKAAQEYPLKFAFSVSKFLIRSFEQRRFYATQRFSGAALRPDKQVW